MTENAENNPSLDLLEKQVRDAFAERNYANVILAIKDKDLPNDFKGSILQEAVEAGSLLVARHIYERAKVELTPEQGMMLLLKSSNKQDIPLSVYLTEKNAENGVIRSDSYAIVFNKFPEGDHESIVNDLYEKAADKQDAANAMLYVAATDRKFTAMPRMLDLGANPTSFNDRVMLNLLTGVPPQVFDNKEFYLSVMDKYLSALDEGGIMNDVALGLATGFAVSGLQYPETVALFLDHGADPWMGHRLAETQWEKKEDKQESDAVLSHERFQTAREEITRKARHEFDTLFGKDFRLADLRQKLNEQGDTGFILAARARVLPQVMQAALKEGPGSLTAADLTHHNEDGYSLLTHAIDRDDAKQVLDAGYWAKTDKEIVVHLQEKTSDQQKEYLDIQAFSAALARQNLKPSGNRFKLGPAQ